MGKSERKTRVWRGILTLIAAVLIFAGPTYIVLLAQNVGIPHTFSVVFGLVLLFLGVGIVYRLVKTGEIE